MRMDGSRATSCASPGTLTIETTNKYAHVVMDEMRHALTAFSVMAGGPKIIGPQNKPQTKA
jgi:hypothetical protein